MKTEDKRGELSVLLIRSLFDGIDDAIAANRYIVIRNGSIEDICERPPGRESLSRGGIIEVPDGLTLLPGLINAHEHLQLRSVDNKQDDYFSADDEELFERMRRNAEKAVEAGITTLRDCGASRHMALKLSRMIGEGKLTGPRLLVCGNAISSPDGHLAWMGREVRGPLEMEDAIREEVAAGADFIKITASGGMASAGTDIKSVQFDGDELVSAVAVAHELGKKITAHAHSTASIKAVVEAGFDMVEHCSWVGPEGIEYDEELVDRMVRDGTVVVFTNATGYPEGRIKEHWLRKIGTIDQRLEIVRDMLRVGVRTIAGTDDSEFDTLPYEMELLYHAGLSPFECLRAATGDSADALGIGEIVGTISPGKRADLIAVAGNPLRDIRALREVKMVIRRGEVIRAL